MSKKLTVGEEIVGMKHDVHYLKEGQDEMKDDVKHIINKIDSLDSKFANKWVERAVYGLLLSVVGGVSYAVIALL